MIEGGSHTEKTKKKQKNKKYKKSKKKWKKNKNGRTGVSRMAVGRPSVGCRTDGKISVGRTDGKISVGRKNFGPIVYQGDTTKKKKD